MLRSFLICPGERLRRGVEDVLPKLPEVQNTGTATSYPSTTDLLRIIRVRTLGLLILDVDDFESAEVLLAFLDETFPGFAVLALASRKNSDLLPKLMRLGLREYLTSPVEAAALAEWSPGRYGGTRASAFY
jgi:DNA-binding NarL/FixJ family response regulator